MIYKTGYGHEITIPDDKVSGHNGYSKHSELMSDPKSEKIGLRPQWKIAPTYEKHLDNIDSETKRAHKRIDDSGTLTITKNGATQGTYNPTSGNKTINIETDNVGVWNSKTQSYSHPNITSFDINFRYNSAIKLAVVTGRFINKVHDTPIFKWSGLSLPYKHYAVAASNPCSEFAYSIEFSSSSNSIIEMELVIDNALASEPNRMGTAVAFQAALILA